MNGRASRAAGGVGSGSARFSHTTEAAPGVLASGSTAGFLAVTVRARSTTDTLCDGPALITRACGARVPAACAWVGALCGVLQRPVFASSIVAAASGGYESTAVVASVASAEASAGRAAGAGALGTLAV